MIIAAAMIGIAAFVDALRYGISDNHHAFFGKHLRDVGKVYTGLGDNVIGDGDEKASVIH